MGAGDRRRGFGRAWAAIEECVGARQALCEGLTGICFALGGGLLTVILPVSIALLFAGIVTTIVGVTSRQSWQAAFKDKLETEYAQNLEEKDAAHARALRTKQVEHEAEVRKAANEARLEALTDQGHVVNAGLVPLIKSVETLSNAQARERPGHVEAAYAHARNAIALMIGGDSARLRVVVFQVDNTKKSPNRVMKVAFESDSVRPTRARPYVEGKEKTRSRRPFRTLDTATPDIVEDITKLTKRPTRTRNGYRSYASIPIVSAKNQALGLLSVDSTKVGALNQHQKPVLLVVARILALVLGEPTARRSAPQGQTAG